MSTASNKALKLLAIPILVVAWFAEKLFWHELVEAGKVTGNSAEQVGLGLIVFLDMIMLVAVPVLALVAISCLWRTEDE